MKSRRRRDSYTDHTDLLRRYSLSLIDRSPPANSLADEILNSTSLTMRASKSIFSNIADIQESLSDFNSCAESTGEISSSSEEDEDSLEKDTNYGFKTVNDKKREKRNKRKLALTPGKEEFLKKPNTQLSPK